ncbi:MAG: biotin/lipoyl-containing protein [Chloroflexota bacterium]|nr:biotin/lipoyl-containing protein [Chloroflexota bacterium]
MKYITIINEREFEIEIDNDGNLRVNGEARAVDFIALGPSLYSILMDNQSHETVIDDLGSGDFDVRVRGRLYSGTVLDERAQVMRTQRGSLAIPSGELSIKSPMPGLIAAIPVTEGQEVKAGQTVIILESMKMQNELKTPRDGVVQRVNVQTGQSVEQNKVLITIV